MGTSEVGLNALCPILLQAYGSGMWEAECNQAHNLIGSGTIRRCGFVGVGMALLEEVRHCGCGL